MPREEEEIYTYLFTGFLDSGKTSLIMGTLQDPSFSTGEKTLIICCEEGEIEYEEEILKKHNAEVVVVEEQEDFTTKFLEECRKKYNPDRVMIEYNGTWDIEHIMELEMPEYWVLVQLLTTVDASTFESYMSNMRSLLVPQFTYSEVVIFNRCTEETPKGSYRRMVKAVNRKAQMVYEREDGTMDNSMDEELPFDITADVIDITEDDYGIWYMDALDHPEHYEGKKLHFKAVIYQPPEFPKDWFVPGRFAMTCCADDIAFIGYKCRAVSVSKFKNRDWAYVTATAKVENVKEYGGEGLVLYAEKLEPAEKSEEELVYFT